MFRNIIWDVDGTLFDTYPAIARAFQVALNDLGKDASLDWIEGLAKTSLSYCVTTLANQCQLNEEDIERAFGEHYDRTPARGTTPISWGDYRLRIYLHPGWNERYRNASWIRRHK